MLKITDLHVNYGNVVALRGVSLEVAAGEVVAVIGPNGAGKSTLLLSIAGVVKARAGTIVLAGRNAGQMQPEALVAAGLSLVPEGRHIFGSLSVATTSPLATAPDRQGSPRTSTRCSRCSVLKDRSQRQQALRRRADAGDRTRAMPAAADALDEPSLGLAPLVVAGPSGVLGCGARASRCRSNRTRGRARSHLRLSSGVIAMSGKSSELAGTTAFDTAYFGVAG